MTRICPVGRKKDAWSLKNSFLLQVPFHLNSGCIMRIFPLARKLPVTGNQSWSMTRLLPIPIDRFTCRFNLRDMLMFGYEEVTEFI